jgi:uncharacterized membrane protein
MHEMSENAERTETTRAFDGETSTPSPEPEWRPSDAPLPVGADGGGSSWTSHEATPVADAAGFGRSEADPRSYVGSEATPARGLRKPPVPSLAAIAGHPLHPMVVPLPIGALTFALVSDLAYVATGDRFWARASTVLLGTGIATGALAGALGATDFTGREQIREHPEAWLHAGGNVAALALSAASLASRRSDPARAIMPIGLGLSLLTGAILAVTGWLGGELSYRHRIGVTAD